MADQIPFGKTGILVGPAGLGCGGYSRLGLGTGHDADNAVAIVRRAVELGVTFIDTSPSYDNEELVGKAVADVRDRVTISTKFSTLNNKDAETDGAAVRRSLEGSLRRLGTDYVDVFAIQSVKGDKYAYVRDQLLPTLQDLKAEGLVRTFGLTEWFFDDTTHETLTEAVDDGCWDYFLVGFNILNQTAQRYVLPKASETGVGVALQFVVRRALSDRDGFRRLLLALVKEGRFDPTGVDLDDPLGFLLSDGSCASLAEAAYRFARHESSGGVVLTGTGNPDHLEENVNAINAGPLPAEHVARLKQIFGALDSLTGQEIVDESGEIAKRHVEGKPVDQTLTTK